MGNFVAIDGIWYNLSDDPTKAAIETTNIKTLGSAASLSQIQSQVTTVDSTVKVVVNEQEMEGVNS